VIFDAIAPAPPDPILGLTEAFKKDPNPKKVNLGVGVYVDDHGNTPILKAVRQAEKILWNSRTTKSYMPISGSPEYAEVVQVLLFGKGHPVIAADRIRTAHTPGGTGGLRVGAEFLKKFAPAARVWLSSPTWPNHKGIFEAAGFKAEEYPYYDAASRGIDFGPMCDALKRAATNDIVVLHVCCHNPTGNDLSDAQWKEVAAIARTRQWLPFLDFAYQGLGEGIAEDRRGLLAMLDTGLECFVSSSFSKNFGLYQDRVGALTLVAADPKAAETAFSHIKTVIRVIYSNPAAHGGAIVTTILKNAELRELWDEELTAMRRRIAAVRSALVAQLKKRGATMDFSFIDRQRGMFSFSGLSDARVAYLRDKKSVYMVGGGRINVAGITSRNVDYVCDSIVEAMTECAS
jgi:aspartate/tyrosine/aromatic aminotransferase